MRHYSLYIQDILDSVHKIQTYTKRFSKDKFIKNSLVVDAVVRNLSIIGEASKRIPVEIKLKTPQIPWKKIIGLRNMLIHEYSGMDKEIVWDIVENKLDLLVKELKPFITKKRKINDFNRCYRRGALGA